MTKDAKTASASAVRSDEESLYRTLVENVRDYAIFMLDPTGHIMTWNLGAQLIKGYAADEIIGQHFSRFYPLAALERRWPEHELTVARSEGRFEDEAWRVRKDGSTFWANVIITALRDKQGNLIGFSKITRDLTERWREQEVLRQSEERFRLLVESVADYAIFMLDVEGRIVSWNTGAGRIKGYGAEEIIGRHFSVFYPPELIAADWPAHELRVARTEGRYQEEGWRLRKDGSRFWANVVLTAIRDRTGELRGYAKITRDLTARQRMEQLEQASRQISEFIAMLAHELRNPLAPIRNAMQVMALRKLNDPQLEWCRGVVDRQVAHLGALVDDLLDVNRITTGKVQLKRETTPVSAVLERALESSAPLLQQRRHHVEIAMPDEPLLVHGDVTRLSQVFLNLINNAAKYTSENGLIRISGRDEGGYAVLQVCDNGVGITPDLLPRIFDLFVQGTRSIDRAEGGLGIGLALVREIVGLHGGSVSAASAGPQRGSEFTVRLPLVRAPDAGPRMNAAQTEAAARKRRILVVDDNQDSAESMAMLLRMSGHEVHTAQDGTAALEQADAHKPEIVLLDIGLPGMSGYTVAQRLRQLAGLRKVILIAMTGYGQEEDRRRSRDAGFNQHLVKPVDLATLTKAVEGSGPAPAAR